MSREQQDPFPEWESGPYMEFSCARCGEGLRMLAHGDPGALTGVCKEHGSMVFVHFPAGVPVSSMASDGGFRTTERTE